MQAKDIHNETVTATAYKRNYLSKYGMVHIHEVVFESGNRGEYHSKFENQTKFIKGRESTYTMEWISKNGFQYNKIKPINADNGTQAQQQPPQGQRQAQQPTNDSRQISIEIQSARRDAITFVCSLLDQNLIKKENCTKLIKQYTKEFYKQSQTLRTELS